MVTLKEIAHKCNVSTATVSNILNGKPKVSEETKNHVLKVADELGYKPNYMAKSLRSKRTRTIGIIAEDIAQFTSPALIEGIMACCEERGYRTFVRNLRLYARWSDKWYHQDAQVHTVLDPAVRELMAQQVDGVIYLAGHARVLKGYTDQISVPVVVAYAYSGTPGVTSVVIDDEKGGYDMTRYLLAMGHRKIGLMGGRADNIHTRKRLLGYQKALYERQLLFDPGLVCYADWTRARACQMTDQLIGRGATAIFCLAEEMAGGVYDRLRQLGLTVGGDISVAGFDNRVIAEYFRPGLTTMEIPLKEIGKTSATLLLDRIEQDQTGPEGTKETEKEIKEIYLPCRLIERKSVRDISL